MEMDYKRYMTIREKEIVFKRQRIFELRQQGLKHEDVWNQLNKELAEHGFNKVSLVYIYKYWNKVKGVQ